jgi:hypothetical protein
MPSIPFPIQSISTITNQEQTTQRNALLVEIAKILKLADISVDGSKHQNIRNTTLETKIDSLITELQLKANLSETQPISYASLLTELQLKANLNETQPISYSALLTELGQKLEPSHLTNLATTAKQDSIKTSIDKIIPPNFLSLTGNLNYQGSATDTFTVFTVPSNRIYQVTNITCTVGTNATWQFEINNASKGLIRTTTTNKVETMIGDIWLYGTESLVAKKYATSTLSYSVNGLIWSLTSS